MDEKMILPYVLESLNLKPDSSETYSKLEGEIQNFMSNGNENLPDVQDALKRALDKGKDLGVVLMKNDSVRLPFKRKQKQTSNGEVDIERPQSSTQKRKPKRQLLQKNQNKRNIEDAKLKATEKFINDFMRKMQNNEAKSRKRRRSSSSRHRNHSFKKLKMR